MQWKAASQSPQKQYGVYQQSMVKVLAEQVSFKLKTERTRERAIAMHAM